MTYEDYLDEVSTLLTEIFTLSDETAIEIVMRAQEDGYFSDHDDDPSLCTQERAEQDARVVFREPKYRYAPTLLDAEGVVAPRKKPSQNAKNN